MWPLLSLVLLACLAPATTRPQTPFFDFKTFAVPASRFNTQPQAQELKTFSPARSQLNIPRFVSFDPVKPEDISFTPARPEENIITRFSPIILPDDQTVAKLAPLTVEDTKPMIDVSSMTGHPYSRPEETKETSELSVTVSDSQEVEMVPFVNLGEVDPATEAPQGPAQSYMKSEEIIKPVMAVQDLPEESEKPAPMTKHELIQMAVDRLKEMEDKMEMMEVIKELQEDNLVVLEPVVEGDVIKVTNGPSMDGMNIIEFEQDGN